MRGILYGLLFLPILLLGAADVVLAEEKPVIYWPYFNLPPQFIVNKSRPEGVGIDVARELQKEMPEYRHVFISASPQRIAEELRTGRERFVVCGLHKTPEREAYVLYSEAPCRVTFSMTIVMRREDVRRLAPDGTASLAYLAADHALTFGYIPGLDHGPFNPFVAPLISNAGAQRAVTAHDVEQLLDMLGEKRIDWFVYDSLGIRYAAGERDKQERFAVVQASECPSAPIFGYLVCSRTGEGAEIMERINRAMARLVASKRLYKTLKGWIPDRLDPAFERACTGCILPATDMSAHDEACPRNCVQHP
ncbi:transporter substrate-binding domain-containing protein [Pseudodesulfovibrio karagichevae]|uniref:Transporter substrate-binding domain-containing protein n=1 Tax=Pseudodesulfovibrio karagichevae TaxID=3239305 RepID=A0ABV4K7F1_9BACT